MTALLLLASLLGAAAHGQEEGTSARPSIMRPGGILLWQSSQGPLSFMTMTPGELPPGARDIGVVQGRSCQHGLSIPVTASIRPTTVSGAIGDGGYHKTLEAMRRERPELAGLYDVKVDVHTISILGFYRRTCVEMLARGYRLPGASRSVERQ